jgi:hypothetical protein
VRIHLAAVLLSGLFFAIPVRAESAPESAEALFVRARALMKAGDCQHALPLLERSHALEPTLGTRFNMAVCEGLTGQLTRAAQHLRSVIDGSSPDDERSAHAARALRELLPRIPHLVIEIDEVGHQVDVVRLDGEPLSGLRANEPFPIDPGVHTLEVTLTGQRPQTLRFSVAERQIYAWSLSGLRAEPKADDGRKPGPATPVARDPSHEKPRSESPPPWTTQRTAALIFAGSSVVAFSVATGFAFSAGSIYRSSESYCTPGDTCQPEGIRRRDRARAHGAVATVGLTVGVASALAGGTLWLTGGRSANEHSDGIRVGVRGMGFGEGSEGRVVLEGRY